MLVMDSQSVELEKKDDENRLTYPLKNYGFKYKTNYYFTNDINKFYRNEFKSNYNAVANGYHILNNTQHICCIGDIFSSVVCFILFMFTYFYTLFRHFIIISILKMLKIIF